MLKHGLLIAMVAMLLVATTVIGLAGCKSNRKYDDDSMHAAEALTAHHSGALDIIGDKGNKKIDLAADIFVSEIPNGYPADTLLRTTNDFKSADYHTQFEIHENISIEKFEIDNTAQTSRSVQLKKLKSWSGRNSSGGPRASNYGDVWSVKLRRKTLYFNINTYEELTDIALPELLYVDNNTGLVIGKKEGESGRFDEVSLFDTNGKMYWSFNTYSSAGSNRYHLVDRYFVYSQNDTGVFIVDYVNNKAVGRLTMINDKIDSFVSGNTIFSGKYVWIICTDLMGEKRKLFRINPETQSVFAYELDNPEKAFFVENNLYIIDSTRSKLFVTDPDTGVISATYNLDDYFKGYQFTNLAPTDHPFICSDGDIVDTYFEVNNCIFNPLETDKSFDMSNNFIGYSNYRNGSWLGWHNYWGADNNRVHGIDTYNGDTTWWIDRSELGKRPNVLIATDNKVLIAHGLEVSLYSVVKE